MSRAPKAVGLCENDTVRIAQMANSATRRLLLAREAGDEGWWGTYAEMAFTVYTANPYITTPRGVARLEQMVVCNTPYPIQNQFYEYIQFGNGRLPTLCQYDRQYRQQIQVLSRNTAVTFGDLTGKPRIIRMYPTNSLDYAGKRVLISGTDSTNSVVYSQDGANRVLGVYTTLGSPFVDCATQFNTITGIQKDVTAGDVQFFEVDPVTGVEQAILTMEPSEETAWYRRYYLNQLPCQCVNGTAGQVTVRAIAKLDFVPVTTDSDYLLIGNIEALTEEMMSIRYSEMDGTDSKEESRERHQQAIRLLVGECQHYLGKNSAYARISLFGSATLERQHIGMI